jgi:hypothetical protein
VTGRSAADVHRADQQLAAEAHTAELFDRLADKMPGGGTRAYVPAGAEPGWLRQLLDDHQAALNSPDAKCCDHIADGQAGPRCVLAWYPGLIVCAPCMATGRFMPDKDSDDEFTCDGCEQVHREGVFSSAIQIMPDTTFHLAVCADCRASWAASSEPR